MIATFPSTRTSDLSLRFYLLVNEALLSLHPIIPVPNKLLPVLNDYTTAILHVINFIPLKYNSNFEGQSVKLCNFIIHDLLDASSNIHAYTYYNLRYDEVYIVV